MQKPVASASDYAYCNATYTTGSKYEVVGHTMPSYYQDGDQSNNQVSQKTNRHTPKNTLNFMPENFSTDTYGVNKSGKCLSRKGKFIFGAVFLTIILALSVAIIVYFAMAKDTDSGQPSTQFISTTGVVSQLMSTTDTVDDTVDNLAVGLDSTIALLSWTWYNDLSDPDAELFSRTSDLFCTQVKNIFMDSELAASYERCEVYQFRKGSVVVRFSMLFTLPTGANSDNFLASTATFFTQSINSGRAFFGADVDILSIQDVSYMSTTPHISAVYTAATSAAQDASPTPATSTTIFSHSLTACKDDEIRCPTGRCIRRTFLCNYANDCGDNWDEHNCSCTMGEMNCRDGGCIPDEWRCDSTLDCFHGDDEEGCGMPLNIVHVSTASSTATYM